jgi:hypothetical protein
MAGKTSDFSLLCNISRYATPLQLIFFKHLTKKLSLVLQQLLHSCWPHLRAGERMVGVELEQTGFQYTGRSLSLISVLGGILVILVIIAFISCYKHRKRVSFHRYILVT